jgi:hypothetical protein
MVISGKSQDNLIIDHIHHINSHGRREELIFAMPGVREDLQIVFKLFISDI